MKKVLILVLLLLALLSATVLVHGTDRGFPESDSAIHVQPTYGG